MEAKGSDGRAQTEIVAAALVIGALVGLVLLNRVTVSASAGVGVK